jgi:hypothetical protein
MTGPDLINGILLRVPRADRDDVDIRLAFDGETRVHMSVADFFAVGTSPDSAPMSLLVGEGPNGDLYCYFPMPFFDRAVIELSRKRRQGRKRVAVEYAVRRMGQTPLPSSGLFGAERSVTEATQPGTGHTVLDQPGRGRWVGLFAELGGIGSASRDYLEGDEMVFIDALERPRIHGTGVEDLFGGGFYFQVDAGGPVRFGTAIHGMVHDRRAPDGSMTTEMYRLFLTDAAVWKRRIRAVIEAGPVNRTEMRARTVSYFYSAPSLAVQ